MSRFIGTAFFIAILSLPASLSFAGQLQASYKAEVRKGMFTQTTRDDYVRELNLRSPGKSGTYAPYQSIDDYSAVLPKNLRIKFTMTSISNQIVSGGGVNADVEPWVKKGLWVFFENHSETADIEISDLSSYAPYGNYAIPLPGPGITSSFEEFDGYYFIYDALVFDGCGNLPTFPIHFKSMVRDVDNDHEILGEFSAYDYTTLTPNGYWSFDYETRAMDADGSVSDFVFEGVTEILCTTLEGYD